MYLGAGADDGADDGAETDKMRGPLKGISGSHSGEASLG